MTSLQPSASSTAPKRITASMFYKYDACPHWLYFDAYGDPAKKARITAFSEMLLRGGMLHEVDVISDLDYVEVSSEGTDQERFDETRALMDKGVPLIYHGFLMDEEFVGVPDLLERRDGGPTSVFGTYHYVPVEIKSAERLADSHKYQLYCYGELLFRIQGVRPKEAYVLNASRTRIAFALDDFTEQFFSGVADIQKTLAGNPPPPHVASSCKQSPWFKECLAFAEKWDDIALLYNVKKKVVVALRELGIRTVQNAADMNIDRVARSDTKLFKRSLLERIVLQARALKEQRHFVRKRIDLPEAPLEIFFDIEGDPLRQVEYLFGFLVRRGGATAPEEYVFQIAEKPEDEAQMWVQFLAWLDTLEGDYIVYHYGTYELSRIIQLEARHGVPSAQQSAINRFRDRLVDLNEIVKEAVVLPLYFYSIKDIGTYIGFTREGSITGGGESVAFYEEWLSSNDRKKLDDIIAYNREDVVATRYLKDWLAEQRDKGTVNEVA